MAQVPTSYYGVDMLPFDGGDHDLAAALRKKG